MLHPGLRLWALCLLTCLAVTAATSAADTYTWNGSQNANWFEPDNWTPAGPPPEGADVVYTNAGTSLILTNATPYLGSFTMAAGTLTCSNWLTRIQASNVVLQAGTITLPAAFTTNAVSNRIHIVCGTLYLGASAALNADGKGYAPGNGPGTTANASGSQGGSGGAGHGGIGGTASSGFAGGVAYGDPLLPELPGSGAGATTSATGGAGGGVIRLDVTQQAVVDGLVSVQGAKGGAGAAYRYGGGGAGGSILLVCDTLSGSGTLRANGADGIADTNYPGGGGGGGRIAAYFNATNQALLPRPTLALSAAPGATAFPLHDRQYWAQADWGSLYLTDPRALVDLDAEIQGVAGYLHTPALTSLDLDTLTVGSGAAFGFGTDLLLTVTNGVTVAGNASLMARRQLTLACATLTNQGKVWFSGTNTITIAGDLVLPVSNGTMSVKAPTLAVGGTVRLEGGVLRVGAAPVAVAGVDTGSTVTVAGDIILTNAGWIYAYADPTNGGSVWFVCSNLNVDATSGFEADGKGYAPEYGPGKTTMAASINGGSGGAGHGGVGGTSSGAQPGGAAYDSAVQPRLSGSGAGNTTSSSGGPGGGVLWINAADHVQLDGVLSANGKKGVAGPAYRYGGGGAGGSILLTCKTLSGSGTLRANGADGIADTSYPGGGGGGGRVAVHFDTGAQTNLPRPNLTFSAAPGASPIPPYARQYWIRADWGSLYMTELESLVDLTPPVGGIAGYLLEPGLTQQTFGVLSVQPGWALGFDTGMTMTATSLSIPSNAAFIARHALQLACDGSATNGGRVLLGGETTLSLGGALEVTGAGAELALNRVTLTVGQDVRVSDAAALRLFSAPTNGLPGDVGSDVTVTGDMRLESGGQLYPYADHTNGGTVRVSCRNLTVNAGSSVNADYKGYGSQSGPGKTAYSGGATGGSGGAGHGGVGGAASSGYAGGTNYGSRSFPWDPGSGAGNSDQAVGGAGGGTVWIDAANEIVLDGTMTADGENGRYGGGNRFTGGGAGGSILLFCRSLTGSGDLSAIGGNGYVAATNLASGGAGGGRIAVWYGLDRTVRQKLLDNLSDPAVQRRIVETPAIAGFGGTVSGVGGGTGYVNGQAGTTAFFHMLAPGTVMTLR